MFVCLCRKTCLPITWGLPLWLNTLLTWLLLTSRIYIAWCYEDNWLFHEIYVGLIYPFSQVTLLLGQWHIPLQDFTVCYHVHDTDLLPEYKNLVYLCLRGTQCCKDFICSHEKKNFDSREYICCAATVPCRDKPQTDTVKDSSIGNDLSKPLELL